MCVCVMLCVCVCGGGEIDEEGRCVTVSEDGKDGIQI